MNNIYVIFIVLFIFVGCGNKNDVTTDYCYEINELSLDFFVSDTVYFNEKTKIDAYINKPLEITLKIDSTEIGTIHQKGSIEWIPTPDQFGIGENYLSVQVRYCFNKGIGSSILSKTKKIVIR